MRKPLTEHEPKTLKDFLDNPDCIDVSMHNELAQFCDSSSAEEREKLISFVAARASEFLLLYNDDSSKGKELIKVLSKEVEGAIEKRPDNMKELSCKKGCAACCHWNVDIGKFEAEIIFEKHKDKIDWKRAEQIAPMTMNQYNQQTTRMRRCMFLDAENSCSIYADRPLACRAYLVRSHPRYCFDRQAKVDRLLILAVEAFRAILFTIGHYLGCGNLGKMLIAVRDSVEQPNA